MAASHLHQFQASATDESEIRMFVANNFLPDRTVLQWHPAASKDLPTLKTNEIVVFSVDSLTTIRLNYSISTLI
jgi:hypothetical protein